MTQTLIEIIYRVEGLTTISGFLVLQPPIKLKVHGIVETKDLASGTIFRISGMVLSSKLKPINIVDRNIL